MAAQIFRWLRGRKRFVLYIALIILLAAGTVLSVLAVTRAGAYLQNEGDWQELAGEYRIGIIDYTVDINGQPLIVQGTDSNVVNTYQMIVPQRAGVRIFDPTVGETLREKEFNEGITLMRVRVVNHSESMVSVNSLFQLAEQAGGQPVRVLSLPVSLDRLSAENLNYRQYVLDTLEIGESTAGKSETEALQLLNASYDKLPPVIEMSIGTLQGASASPPSGDWIQNGGIYYSYKDVFLIVWSEYGEGEYNSAVNTDGSSPDARWGRFHATFTVGQVE